jgi:hypothetical protein
MLSIGISFFRLNFSFRSQVAHPDRHLWCKNYEKRRDRNSQALAILSQHDQRPGSVLPVDFSFSLMGSGPYGNFLVRVQKSRQTVPLI